MYLSSSSLVYEAISGESLRSIESTIIVHSAYYDLKRKYIELSLCTTEREKKYNNNNDNDDSNNNKKIKNIFIFFHPLTFYTLVSCHSDWLQNPTARGAGRIGAHDLWWSSSASSGWLDRRQQATYRGTADFIRIGIPTFTDLPAKTRARSNARL